MLTGSLSPAGGTAVMKPMIPEGPLPEDSVLAAGGPSRPLEEAAGTLCLELSSEGKENARQGRVGRKPASHEAWEDEIGARILFPVENCLTCSVQAS